ncbi:polysaccharide biosynthesis C-terminal domain-containing protein [Aquimarina sp. 2201CG5-10]|uniref:oligosaccharide flippase family protein n=1 Tax=Aquimarina callyspongiae TaxID=3098150 RepID=UPI002AB4C6F8|nr:polysaccharide biosynthesis C-terminal domain-containing protein [Aquimarina sp. 2201CG5-10]MDY8138725.1 polysaccharide biosynthesis C-terminal domain-containing protein [Aquimarina sp. 2201CG5-10]
MGIFQKLFKQTFIYGLATVLPRMLSFLLVVVHTAYLDGPVSYGKVSIIFVWIIIFNVLLAYGMETSFFRFLNLDKHKNNVTSTASISIITTTTIFVVIALLAQDVISNILGLEKEYLIYVIFILAFDALMIIPFADLRAKERPIRYSVIKVFNVVIYAGLNVFFLIFLEDLVKEFAWLELIYKDNFEVQYIFIAMAIASASTLLMVSPFYLRIKYQFDKALWRKMIVYGTPILISGLAFAINEHFDKQLLEWILDGDTGLFASGAYSACYKLALFMTLFATAFRMGIEPFFFSHAKDKNAPETYATITLYFVIFGAFILLTVTTFSQFLKEFMIRKPEYWEAMAVVPLILVANFCLGIYHNLSVWYKITDRTKFGAYISVVGALLTLTLNLILIPKYSYMGSAVATLIAYTTMMLLSWYFGKKYYPIPYNLKKIGMYLSLSIGFSILSFYVFDSNLLISIPLLLVFLVILYASEKKELKRILKR